MEKMKMETENLVDENIKKLMELFPSVVTETVKDGKVERAVDFDALKQELSDVVVEGNEERYQLTWPDKRKARLLANTPIKATLRPCVEKSVNFDTTQNLYIEGDNLDVLKLLKLPYRDKIKVIYIDPPYNTGNDFVYEDDFAMSINEYNGISGDYDNQGNRLTQNSDNNGRYHTDWLNMIYPRLRLSKELLAENGVIFISIDENELSNLIKICDEVFSSSNFVSNIIWYKNNSKGNVKQISTVTEYVVCYARNKAYLPNFIVKKANAAEMCSVAKELFLKNNEDVDKTNSEFRAWMSSHNIEAGEKKYNKVDENGRLYTDKPLTAPGSKLFYDIIHPVTGRPCKTASRGWAYKKESFEKLKESGHILFGKDETTCPYLKYFLDENLTEVPTSHIRLTANNAVDMQNLGFQKEEFSYPKPVSLLKHLINMVPFEDEYVLDFFSGSATTAHAVMQLNAEDGGTRKFIMVQLPEVCGEDSEAYMAGYKTICEIGEERIRRAGKVIKEEAGLLAQNLDVGFRVLKLDSSNMKDVYYKPEESSQQRIDEILSNVKEDRTPMDLLFQVMRETDVLYSSKIEEKTIEGKKVFIINDDNLICCFDDDIGDDVVKAIAQMKPLYAVFRDSSFKSDDTMVNAEQYFRTYSPRTGLSII